ncbi:SDR family NAD(P)-dependent oxidoreductase [Cohnella sp. CFH 77786]|uniref:SDR family NAD(P)-dependent oxidoreductase n=1 Tax=Cohnella sp. CFH 77786 TaxID=2662265 RepID=UPI001C60C9E2|nr:SDR family oxidoreductase [Cohnella sp. CFH 77786]MBW5448854.1 SDR family NAD(P)-dependent oxidoreductase [Cohnella sp. CFH 77786]
MDGLSGKTVMITGASRGLGRALAVAFAQAGANLALSARGETALRTVKRELEELGAEVEAVTGDMSVSRDVERFVAVAEEAFGKIDVLINNASILGPSPMPLLLDYPEADFAEVLRVNAVGPFLVTRRVLPQMLTRGSGSIVNVTSEAGNVGYAGWGAYGISKFALEGLTGTWADEVRGTGVRVNMVDPGEMDTDMHALAVPDCDYELAQPHEVTDVFLYLASDEAKEINGQRYSAQEFARERRGGA